jgi:uncharacterized membrane protein
MEAFSDGVLAIIITIMVIELHPPAEATLAALGEAWHHLTSYVLSFAILGTYWSNHHHLLQAVQQVNGRILWANLHLLFWLSLVPFTTNWVGDTRFAPVPVAVYGVVFFAAGLAYALLTRALISHHGKASPLAAAVGRDFKGLVSLVLYAAAIPIALGAPLVALGIYVVVELVWFIPDRRIERALDRS